MTKIFLGNLKGPKGDKGDPGDAGTSAVTSVNGDVGAVVVTASSIGAASASALSTESTNRSNADALLIPLAQKNANSGVATLDSSGHIPLTQFDPQTTIDTLAGAVTSARFLRGNGTHVQMAAIQASDVPTLNQDTSGTAAGLSGTPPLPNGTTATTQSAADSSTKVATTAYADNSASAAASGKLNKSGDTMNGYFAPKVTLLSDAATILVDAALGNEFFVTLGGSRTMDAPSNPHNGQPIIFEVASAGHALAWNAAYNFGSDSVPDTTVNSTYLFGFRYSSNKSAWLYTGNRGGF